MGSTKPRRRTTVCSFSFTCPTTRIPGRIADADLIWQVCVSLGALQVLEGVCLGALQVLVAESLERALTYCGRCLSPRASSRLWGF